LSTCHHFHLLSVTLTLFCLLTFSSSSSTLISTLLSYFIILTLHILSLSSARYFTIPTRYSTSESTPFPTFFGRYSRNRPVLPEAFSLPRAILGATSLLLMFHSFRLSVSALFHLLQILCLSSTFSAAS